MKKFILTTALVTSMATGAMAQSLIQDFETLGAIESTTTVWDTTGASHDFACAPVTETGVPGTIDHHFASSDIAFRSGNMDCDASANEIATTLNGSTDITTSLTFVSTDPNAGNDPVDTLSTWSGWTTIGTTDREERTRTIVVNGDADALEPDGDLRQTRVIRDVKERTDTIRDIAGNNLRVDVIRIEGTLDRNVTFANNLNHTIRGGILQTAGGNSDYAGYQEGDFLKVLGHDTSIEGKKYYRLASITAPVVVQPDVDADVRNDIVILQNLELNADDVLVVEYRRSDTDIVVQGPVGSIDRTVIENGLDEDEFDRQLASTLLAVSTGINTDNWPAIQDAAYVNRDTAIATVAAFLDTFRSDADMGPDPVTVTDTEVSGGTYDMDSKAKYVTVSAVVRTVTYSDGSEVETVLEEARTILNPGWIAAANKLENKLADDIKNGQKLVGQFEHFVLVINTASSGVEIKKEFVVAKSGVDKLTITPRLGLGLGGDANYRSYGAEVAYETTEIRDLLLKLGYDTGTHFDFTQGSIDGYKSLSGNGNTGDYGYVYIEQGAADEIKVTVKADTQDDYSIGLKKGPYSASVNQDGQVSAKYTVKF